MAKQSGLGDRLLIAGIDLSGDIGSVERVAGANAYEPERSMTSAMACGGRTAVWPPGASGAWIRTSTSTVLSWPAASWGLSRLQVYG